MKDEFEVHAVDLKGGGRSVIAWSLAHWKAGADAARPLRLEVRARLAQPNAAGMPDDEEGDRLTRLQDKLPGVLKRKAKAKYAMRVAGEGEVVHVFYAPRTVGLLGKRDVLEVVRPLVDKLAGEFDLALDASAHEDAQWSRLLTIFPSRDPEQYHTDRHVVLQMAKQRDALGAPRTVAHRAHFPDREGCREFFKDARKLKFKSEGGPRKAGADDPGAFTGVVLRKEPNIMTGHIHVVALTVKGLVEQHGGTYEGWEPELVKRTDPEPLAPPGGFKVG